ncbi:relaxase/mobilization nuclease domain-containing protein [Escherichia coli]|nr:relaxase [Salmonella enterica]EEZ4167869.1 relaxase/mobilization nuclease domain-containing protein [Escherichia coli]EBL9739500.1 relaxase [Salmonella enterica]EFF2793693.1 relaxase/mobilization nuclease domain-containing protein [Escherichia coli]EFF2920184.1 relaxase/mobilization nuclease domain-containing protein [Escherichia coli]
MKGMQKIKRGKSFAGVVLYALRSAYHHKVAPVVIGGNMMGSFAKELIAEFDATKTLRSDVAKPVWHNSLRLPKSETLTDAQWSGIADDYMKRMGFSETHLRCYVLHDDEDGQHIHIIASRVSLDAGRLYLGRNENLISTRVIQQLERDYHLTKTKSPDDHNPSASPAKRKKSRDEAMLEDRTGEKCAKTIIQEAIDTLLTSQISEDEFVQQLAAQKIKAVPNRASTGKMNGFSFEYANISFKASQLGKKYSWKNLEPFIVMSSLPDKNESCVLNDIRENFNEAKETGKNDLSLEEHQTVIKSCFPLLNPTDILLPLPEKAVSENNNVYTGKVKPNSKSYIDITMRWLETIPFIDLIVNTFKKLNNSLLKAYKKTFRIFSATFLSLEPPSLLSVEKYTQKSGFGLKN